MVCSSEYKVGGTALIQILFGMDLIKKSDSNTIERKDIQTSFSNGIHWLKETSKTENIKEDELKKRLYHEFISVGTDFEKFSQWLNTTWRINNIQKTNLNSKRKLQEITQKFSGALPEYTYFKQKKGFKAVCVCIKDNNTYVTRAKGNSKKEASRVSAELMLQKFKEL